MSASQKSKCSSTVANITGDIPNHVQRADIRNAVVCYVADRIARECKNPAQRGLQAKIARATGKSRAHVSSIVSGTSGVSIEFAERMAPFWGMTVEELEKIAVAEWEEGEDTPTSKVRGGPTRRICDRPEWGAALDAARSFYHEIPDEFFDRVGAIFDDVTGPIDAEFVGEMAKLLRDLTHRHAPKSGRVLPPMVSGIRKTKK